MKQSTNAIAAAMSGPKHPIVITALKSKAALVRQAASDHNLPYEEKLVPGDDNLIRFCFEPLDDAETIMFLADVPRSAYAYHGIIHPSSTNGETG